MSDSFTCAQCGETFEKIRSDAEAWDEALDLFAETLSAGVEVVCHDCWLSTNEQYPIADFVRSWRAAGYSKET